MNATLGMIGLGRMGGNMSRRIARAGHTVVAWDRAEAARSSLADEPRIVDAVGCRREARDAARVRSLAQT